MTAIACPGCGLVHESTGLEPPRDLDATGECARDFGTISAAFYETPSLVPRRQYVVDAYAAQHPSTASRRAVQSTALGLMTLDLVFEVGVDVEFGPRLHTAMMRDHPSLFTPLPRPDLSGALTYRHLAPHVGTDALAAAAREWAASVWGAWREHRAQIRAWNEALVPEWLPR